MRAPGCDPEDLQPSDFLCDFCGRAWSEDRPMVEGHQGSCICGSCLADAFRAIVVAGPDQAGGAPSAAASRCTLCLEVRDEPAWSAGGLPGAVACRRCVRQSAAVLQKDAESGWRRPER